MERKYTYSYEKTISFMNYLVEQQLDFLVDNEFGQMADIYDKMSSSEYERLVAEVAVKLKNNEIWEDVNRIITDYIVDFVKRYKPQ